MNKQFILEGWTVRRLPSQFRFCLLVLMAGFILPLSAQAPNWTVPQGVMQQQFSCSIVAVVVDTEGRSADTGDEVGAFIENADGEQELRGTGFVIGSPGSPGELRYFVTVFSDRVGEDISFRVYHAETDEIYTVPVTLTFRTPDPYGSDADPVELPLGDVYVAPVLPVAWLGFTARPNSKGEVGLDWSTTLEEGNRGFTVQRSEEGLRFEDLGFVAGAEDGEQTNQYRYTDRSVERNGMMFYRLRQEDFDGSYAYSEVLQVQTLSTRNKVAAYPNPLPVGSPLTISFTAVSDGPIELQLLSTDGQLLKQFTPEVRAGSNTIILPLLNFDRNQPAQVWLVVKERDQLSTELLLLR